MKGVKLPVSLVQDVQALISKVDAIGEADPGMRHAAAMVHIGDVYALREEMRCLRDYAWGGRRYTGSLGDDPL